MILAELKKDVEPHTDTFAVVATAIEEDIAKAIKELAFIFSRKGFQQGLLIGEHVCSTEVAPVTMPEVCGRWV